MTNTTAQQLMAHLDSQIKECQEKKYKIIDKIGEVGYLSMEATLVELKVDFIRILGAN